MKNKTNSSDRLAITTLFAAGFLLLISVILSVFGIWSWELAMLYAINAAIFAWSMFEEYGFVKVLLLSVAMITLQFLTCGAAFVVRSLF